MSLLTSGFWPVVFVLEHFMHRSEAETDTTMCLLASIPLCKIMREILQPYRLLAPRSRYYASISLDAACRT